MSGPSQEPPAPAEERADPVDFADLRDRFVHVGRLAWRETRLTALAVWSQSQRLIAYLRAGWKTRRLEQRRLAAEVALGETLDVAQLGDPKLRARLADLRERRQSFVAARESTRGIDAECRGLCVRLAEPYLGTVEPPAEVRREHRQALALKVEIADRLDRQSERRSHLFPVDFATRIRTAIGIGLALVAVSLLFSRIGARSSTEGFLLPPQVDLESLQPLAAFPLPKATGDVGEGGGEQVETRELDLDADDTLPARHVEVTLINGRPEGEVRSVDASGRLICSERYRAGRLNGPRQRFYPTGNQQFSELRFVDGVAQNAEVIWFPNGKVASRTEVVDGIPHGKSEIKFENGHKCVVTSYVKGQPHGQRYHYRPDGTCFAVVTWENGKPVSQEFLQIEVTEADEAAIKQRGNFSTRLVDHWE